MSSLNIHDLPKSLLIVEFGTRSTIFKKPKLFHELQVMVRTEFNIDLGKEFLFLLPIKGGIGGGALYPKINVSTYALIKDNCSHLQCVLKSDHLNSSGFEVQQEYDKPHVEGKANSKVARGDADAAQEARARVWGISPTNDKSGLGDDTDTQEHIRSWAVATGKPETAYFKSYCWDPSEDGGAFSADDLGTSKVVDTWEVESPAATDSGGWPVGDVERLTSWPGVEEQDGSAEADTGKGATGHTGWGWRQDQEEEEEEEDGDDSAEPRTRNAAIQTNNWGTWEEEEDASTIQPKSKKSAPKTDAWGDWEENISTKPKKQTKTLPSRKITNPLGWETPSDDSTGKPQATTTQKVYKWGEWERDFEGIDSEEERREEAQEYRVRRGPISTREPTPAPQTGKKKVVAVNMPGSWDLPEPVFKADEVEDEDNGQSDWGGR
ncbi:hypothetical protein QBC35DRAFT_470113 [Podospora australis]|uniref:Uncharacterized protein n=1 Tax=Podospora australis TaxID=1536484 RepID=A0AAN7AM82_9PEZI|nr:hypothetical protein QBC35DRAFT_470113 [Podospora australis]